MKVLLIGPDPAYSKGGMASVIETIRDDRQLNEDFEIDVYGSCVRGNIVKRMAFSIYAFLKFCLTKHDYDIYHLHIASRGSTFRKSYYAQFAKRWRKKVIIQIHSGDYIDFYENLSSSKQKRVISTLKAVDIVLALSDGWKKIFEETFGLTNCKVVENAVNVEQLQEGYSKPKACLCSFAVLGRLVEQKGTFDLINAVERAKKDVPDIIVYLAGDGDLEKVKYLVIEKNLQRNVKLVGWVDDKKKIELLREVCTIVLPSYHEGLPMAILEGMASGKAIISTTVGAIPEVVGEENGILIQPGDVQALADALIKCATNVDMVEKMSACNREKIEQKYSMKHMSETLGKLYRGLL